MRGLGRFPPPNQEKDQDADDNHQDRADQNQSSWHCRALTSSLFNLFFQAVEHFNRR
jgi:hypothetical protein